MSSQNDEPYHVLRDVSDLRIQYQCEYLLYLKQTLVDLPNPAGATGTRLHAKQKFRPTRKRMTGRTRLRIVLILAVPVILLLVMGWSM